MLTSVTFDIHLCPFSRGWCCKCNIMEGGGRSPLNLDSLLFDIAALCHDRFPWIRKGTQDKSDLAQPPGQALSHWVSNSDRGWFTGVSLVRFKLREGSSLSVGNYIHEWGCHKYSHYAEIHGYFECI